MSTWPAPNSVAMSALVGVMTKSRITPSAFASSRFLARKKAMLHKPDPCVALMVVVPAWADADISEPANPNGSATVKLAAPAPLRKPRREGLLCGVDVRWL